jgi:NADH-quinone oxidoreductase subunit N
LWLAIMMAVNSILGSYYYLRLIIVMYMRDYKGSVPLDAFRGLSPTAGMVVAVAAIITLYLGLAPNHVLGVVLSHNLILSAR